MSDAPLLEPLRPVASAGQVRAICRAAPLGAVPSPREPRATWGSCRASRERAGGRAGGVAGPACEWGGGRLGARSGRQVHRGGSAGLLLPSFLLPARLSRREPRGVPVRTLRASWRVPNCHPAPRHSASGPSGHTVPGSHEQALERCRSSCGQPCAAGSGARGPPRAGPATPLQAWPAPPRARGRSRKCPRGMAVGVRG